MSVGFRRETESCRRLCFCLMVVGFFGCGSGQNLFDDVSVNVSQSEVATLESVGQAFVVDPEQMQHGGVQVVDMDFVFHGAVAEFICSSPGKAWLDSAARHPT